MNELVNIRQKKELLISASRADETKRAVRKHWTHFENWCQQHGYQVFPTLPEVLEEYLIYRSEDGVKSATIDQIKWAIDFRHKLSGHVPPGNFESVKSIIAGIKRTKKYRINQKKALTPEHYKHHSFEKSLSGLREKLIILLGFSGGLRRSELSALCVNDIEFNSYGMRIMIPYSKTNQEGAIEHVDIVYGSDDLCCPVITAKEWLKTTNLKEGCLLRNIRKSGNIGVKLSTVTINKIVKNFIGRQVIDPENYSCHSLRSGFATYMLSKKVSVNIVAKQLRHKKLETTLRYDRNSVADSIKGLY